MNSLKLYKDICHKLYYGQPVYRFKDKVDGKIMISTGQVSLLVEEDKCPIRQDKLTLIDIDIKKIMNDSVELKMGDMFRKCLFTNVMCRILHNGETEIAINEKLLAYFDKNYLKFTGTKPNKPVLVYENFTMLAGMVLPYNINGKQEEEE